MKKILNSFFIILSILLLSGCGEEKPEVVAKNFIDSFSKGDNQKVLEYLNKKDKERFLNDTTKGCENAFIETIEKGFSFSSNKDEIEISKIFSKVIDDLSNDGIVLGMMNLDYEQKLKVSNICLSPFIQLMKNNAKKRKIQILNIKVISTEVKEGEATVKVEGNIFSKIERIELIKEDNKWVIKDYKKVLR